MSHWKSSGLAIFAVVCLLGKTTGSAHAQCNSFGTLCAAEWNGGSAINLGGLPGSTGGTQAYDINDVGQAVGVSFVRGSAFATEWSGGSAINLGGLPSSAFSEAFSINDVGEAAGFSENPFVPPPPPPPVVPEPSTWAMMLLGFASLGYAGYRLRST